ncbi:hypothetical protein LTR39_002961, partial [Cryomyces antarcticus]
MASAALKARPVCRIAKSSLPLRLKELELELLKLELSPSATASSAKLDDNAYGTGKRPVLSLQRVANRSPGRNLTQNPWRDSRCWRLRFSQMAHAVEHAITQS